MDRQLNGRRDLWTATLIVLLTTSAATAQQLEPRFYSNSPVGVSALAIGYTRSGGNVLLVPSLPLDDVDGDLNLAALTYLRVVDFFGRSAKLSGTLPYAWGEFRGFLEGEFRTRNLAGWGDPLFRLAVNLKGAPALDVKEFASYQQGTIVGADLMVAVPVGKYEPDRLFNLGANRWTLRPGVGVSTVWRSKWFFELGGGIWLFTRNDDFFGGSTLDQKPIFTIKGHAIRVFRPGLWLSFDLGYGRGGEWKINGEPRGNVQRNYRIGTTFSFPLGGGNTIKAIGAKGVAKGFGSNFDAFVVVYQYTWVGSLRK
jgi:hypothetical protein